MIIGIVHHKSTEKFLPDLLNSLQGVKYPVNIIFNNEDNHKRDKDDYNFQIICNPRGGYELGALKIIVDSYDKEEDFFLMHETIVIKDLEIFDIAAQYNGSLAISPGYASFLGKYRREILNQIGIPVPQSKIAAIYYEYFWNIIYMNAEENIAMCDDPLIDRDVFEEKFGRMNMMLENKYMKKWKSNYDGFKLKVPPMDYINKL